MISERLYTKIMKKAYSKPKIKPEGHSRAKHNPVFCFRYRKRYRKSGLRQFCYVCGKELHRPFKSRHCSNDKCRRILDGLNNRKYRISHPDNYRAYQRNYYYQKKLSLQNGTKDI